MSGFTHSREIQRASELDKTGQAVQGIKEGVAHAYIHVVSSQKALFDGEAILHIQGNWFH